ncbi:MAG: hypothetical protein [Circular genetic element sp.]|nr:MAG: hypothetical protein [Circular genetic element sp.]
MAKKRIAKRIARAKPIQTVCNAGPLGALAGSTTGDYYINAAHIMSMMNRKAFHQVTRDGHLKNYGLRIQVFNMVNASTTIRTASTSYPTYNATRAWHFARKERLSDAGFSLNDLGYGNRLRFALDKTMSDTNQSTSAVMISPSHLTDTVDNQGEWDWSDVIITPPVDNAGSGVEADDLFDSFVLQLCGDHTRETTGSETMKFTHVGMIQSWTENRRGWAAPSAEEVIQPENPLAFARASDLSSLQLTTEVSDEQKQSPPYSNTDDDDAESVFAELVIQGQLESAFPNPTTNTDMVIAPGGLAKVSITNNTVDISAPMLSVEIIELD